MPWLHDCTEDERNSDTTVVSAWNWSVDNCLCSQLTLPVRGVGSAMVLHDGIHGTLMHWWQCHWASHEVLRYLCTAEKAAKPTARRLHVVMPPVTRAGDLEWPAPPEQNRTQCEEAMCPVLLLGGWPFDIACSLKLSRVPRAWDTEEGKTVLCGSSHKSIYEQDQRSSGVLMLLCGRLQYMCKKAHPYTMLDRFWGMNLWLLRVSISWLTASRARASSSLPRLPLALRSSPVDSSCPARTVAAGKAPSLAYAHTRFDNPCTCNI